MDAAAVHTLLSDQIYHENDCFCTSSYMNYIRYFWSTNLWIFIFRTFKAPICCIGIGSSLYISCIYPMSAVSENRRDCNSQLSTPKLFRIPHKSPRLIPPLPSRMSCAPACSPVCSPVCPPACPPQGSSINGQLNSLLKSFEQVCNDNQALKGANCRLQSDNQALGQAVEHLRCQTGNIKNVSNQLRCQNDDLKRCLSQCQNAYEQLKRQVSQLQCDNGNLKNANQQMSCEHNDLRQKFGILQQSISRVVGGCSPCQ